MQFQVANLLSTSCSSRQIQSGVKRCQNNEANLLSKRCSSRQIKSGVNWCQNSFFNASTIYFFRLFSEYVFCLLSKILFDKRHRWIGTRQREELGFIPP